MKCNSIENLIEKLSCDFVLADLKEPESLSGLLPTLKLIHTNCIELSFDDDAKEVVKVRKIIEVVLKDTGKEVDNQV